MKILLTFFLLQLVVFDSKSLTIDFGGRAQAEKIGLEQAHYDMATAENNRLDQLYRWNVQLLSIMEARAKATLPLSTSKELLNLQYLAQQKCADTKRALVDYECLSANSILLGTAQNQLAQLKALPTTPEVNQAILLHEKCLQDTNAYVSNLLNERSEYYNFSFNASVDARVAKRRQELDCNTKSIMLLQFQKALSEGVQDFQSAKNYKAVRDTKDLLATVIKILPALKARCEQSRPVLDEVLANTLKTQAELAKVNETLWISEACKKAKDISELAAACRSKSFTDSTISILWQLEHPDSLKNGKESRK